MHGTPVTAAAAYHKTVLKLAVASVVLRHMRPTYRVSTGRQREGVFWTPLKYKILILRGPSQFEGVQLPCHFANEISKQALCYGLVNAVPMVAKHSFQ